jgi:hypothetical protein
MELPPGDEASVKIDLPFLFGATGLWVKRGATMVQDGPCGICGATALVI